MIRRFLLSGIIILLFLNISAQSTTADNYGQINTKNGKAILPVAGEFGIGLNAIPFIDLFGELIKFNSSNRFNNPLSFETPDGQQLFLKYFINSKTAYRARLGLAYHSGSETFPVNNDKNTGVITVDKRNEQYTIITTSFGLEKRKGMGRIQGIFGTELNLLYQNGTPELMNYKYSYANAISADNTSPSTALFLDGTPRPQFEKTFTSFGIGATGFFGLEFFIAPKISLGGEMGLKAMYINHSKSQIKTEVWNPTSSSVQQSQTIIEKGGQFDATINFNSNGVLFIMFYF